MNGNAMSNDTLQVRPAERADLDAVISVFEACWSTSYAAVLPAQLVAAMTHERARALWTRVLAEAAPGELLVAVTDGIIVGLSRWAVPDRAAPGWVHSLYVAPATQGHGVGRRLLDAAEQAILRAGAGVARLWVFAANAPSIAFYTGSGWAQDGSTRVEDEFGEPEIGMTKRLVEP